MESNQSNMESYKESAPEVILIHSDDHEDGEQVQNLHEERSYNDMYLTHFLIDFNDLLSPVESHLQHTVNAPASEVKHTHIQTTSKKMPRPLIPVANLRLKRKLNSNNSTVPPKTRFTEAYKKSCNQNVIVIEDNVTLATSSVTITSKSEVRKRSSYQDAIVIEDDVTTLTTSTSTITSKSKRRRKASKQNVIVIEDDEQAPSTTSKNSIASDPKIENESLKITTCICSVKKADCCTLCSDFRGSAPSFPTTLFDSQNSTLKVILCFCDIIKLNCCSVCSISKPSTPLFPAGVESAMYPSSVDPRQENHAQSVHLHMHHFCPCLNMVYQYCPPPYRPPIVSYAQNRPYNLHHYQYTQFNMVPYSSQASATVAPQHALNIPSSPHHIASDAVFGQPCRDRRNLERLSTQEAPEAPSCSNNLDKNTRDSTNVRCFSPQEIQESTSNANGNSSGLTTDTFLKFLESSCVRAEQIAQRNRNRPCFRNIQNLCMRTRSEIMKPCTTISNIHSQGIPWATKDFIYAFIRLVNCWHILKGYLEKDGSLGKIDKELTSDFKSCYYKWEQDSMELAEELQRIFCNLDANISNPTPSTSGVQNQENASTQAAQAIYLNNRSPQTSPKTNEPNDSPGTVIFPTTSKEKNHAKGTRGILHIASSNSDQVVVLDSSDSSDKEGDSDNDGRVYMKPGSYSVPKKNESTSNSPRSFEFLETAQNVHRRVKEKPESVDKMWQNAQTAAPSLISKMSPTNQEVQVDSREEGIGNIQDLLPGGTDVQSWIDTGLYPVVNEAKVKEVHQNNPKPIVVLQRAKSTLLDVCGIDENSQYFLGGNGSSSKQINESCSKINIKPSEGENSATLSRNSNIKVEITSRTYRKRVETSELSKVTRGRIFPNEENKRCGNLPANSVAKFKEIINEMKATEFSIQLNRENIKVSAFSVLELDKSFFCRSMERLN